MSIINTSDFNIEKDIEFSDVCNGSKGNQMVFVKNKLCDTKTKKITLMTPKCKVPFGLSEYKESRGNYTLNLSLGDSSKQCEFKEFLKNLELKLLECAHKNSKSWFKKQLTIEVIQSLYNSCIKQKNEKYPPLMRLKFPTNESGEFMGNIYDIHKTKVNQDIIQPGCEVETIIELTGIYFIQKEFGMTWKVIQIKVQPIQRISGYAFNDSDDEIDEPEPY